MNEYIFSMDEYACTIRYLIIIDSRPMLVDYAHAIYFVIRLFLDCLAC